MPTTTPSPAASPARPLAGSNTPARPARRAGRVLIECLLALTLLAVSALTLTASTRAIATLADDALLVASAQSAAHTSAERALATPCDASTLGAQLLAAPPRVIASATTDRGPSLLAQTVEAQLAPSPFSLRDTQRLTLSAARPCR